MKVYIHTIDHKFNEDCFPTYINDNEIISKEEHKYDNNKYIISQYSLEYQLHKIFNNYSDITTDINICDIIYIPIYLFLLAWKRCKYVYNVSDVINHLNGVLPFITLHSKIKKILLVYSDVMWEDNRVFINKFYFNENVYCVCYETVNSTMNKQIPVPFVTHIKCKPSEYTIPFNQKRKNIICYIGRERKEIHYFNNIVTLPLSQHNNQWISINNSEIYNKIDNLYLNSTFSLQPHGDKQTRKGFYNSILLGCIPVIFENNSSGYKTVFKNFELTNLCVIIKQDELNDIERILESIEQPKIDNFINNYDKVKNILLYDEDNMDILINIFSFM